MSNRRIGVTTQISPRQKPISADYSCRSESIFPQPMKNSLRFLALAALVALPFVSRAQVTYDNLGGISGNVSLLNSSAIQTFTGLSSISTLTWTVTNATGNAGSSTNFQAYIAQWTNPTSASSTLQTFGSVASVTGIALNGTSDLVFTPGSPLALNPALTYALILSDTTGSTVFAATTGSNPGGTFFGSGGAGSFGQSVFSAGGLVPFESSLSGTGTGFAGSTAINSSNAYAMSVTGITPVPEPKTAAAGIAALFIAALVGRRMMLRRKQATAPLAA